MGKLNVDDSEIKSITGISISEVSGNFSNEWLSCTFIDNVIKEINSLISSFNQVKGEANNYTDTNEEISNQPEPTVPHSGGGSGHGSSSNGSDAKFFTTGLVNNYSNLPDSTYRSNGKVIYRKTLTSSSNSNYVFRMWYSYAADVYKESKQFGCKVAVDAYYE